MAGDMERMVWLTAPKGKIKRLREMVEEADGEVLGVSSLHDDRRTMAFILEKGDRQALFDDITKELDRKDWRMVVQGVEAVVPQSDQTKEDNAQRVKTREELYEDVVGGARFDLPQFALIAVSSVMAAVGMIGDSVAVVIGAMVIAPLLGPILAMILGTALGERKLMQRSLGVGVTGLAIAVAIGAVTGFFVGFDPETPQIAARSDIGLEGIALALASGAAAALSLTTGVSAVLVGVMVAASLLPPAVAIGLFLGQGLGLPASGAALLFFANVAAVTLSGQAVFLLQGVRPRSWYKKQAAQQSVSFSLVFWTVALTILFALEYLRSLLANGTLGFF